MASVKKKRKTSRRSRSISGGNLIAIGNRIFVKMLPFILIFVLIGAGVRLIVVFIESSDYFKVHNIRMMQKDHGKSPEEMDIDLDSKKGMNIFSVGLKACEDDIRRTHPEIKDVTVKVVLPDTLEVSYYIREPFCQIDSGYFYLVSYDSVILPKRLMAADPQLPIITGIDISERHLPADRKIHSDALLKGMLLLKDIQESDFSNKRRIIKVNILDPRNPSLFMEDGTRIEIGEYSFRERQKLLTEVLDDLDSKNKKAKIIDLRFDDIVVIPR